MSVTSNPTAGREPVAERTLRDPWLVRTSRLLISVAAAQSLVGAVLLLGYLYQRMQRHAICVWSGGSQRFVSPRWFAGEHFDCAWGRRIARTGRSRILGSLLDNFRIGCSAAFALAAFAAPLLLLSISWHAGWNGSFSKNYEDASLAPLLATSGIILAMMTLCYLPFAQARHAATGDWRCLFHWRANITLAACRSRGLFLLPLTALALSVISLASRGLLTFVPQMPAFTDAMDDPAAFTNRWFFCWGVLFVITLYFCKRTIARGYARTVAQAVQLGRVDIANLHPEEQQQLIRFGFHNATTIRPPRLTASLIRILLPLPLWFPILGLLYVQQFINNVGTLGWLHLPFAWVPMLAYQP